MNRYMTAALINIAACALGVHQGNFGLAVLNAGVALALLAQSITPLQSNPK